LMTISIPVVVTKTTAIPYKHQPKHHQDQYHYNH
jgi:hypothetical protein